MKSTLYGIRWARVLLTVIATHLLNVVLVVMLVIVASFLAAGTGSDSPGEVPTGRLAESFATWGIPVLTILAAAWVAREAQQLASAVLHGTLVGILVALVFGVTFFLHFDPATLALFVLIIAAGSLGGMVGARFPWRWDRKH